MQASCGLISIGNGPHPKHACADSHRQQVLTAAMLQAGARLKFVGAPYLAKLGELTPLTTDNSVRKSFLAEIKQLLR